MKSCRMFLLSIALLLCAGCKKSSQPEPLHPEDICAVCKMAVSEQHFAAQALLPNGDYVKFDDVGCLMKYQPLPKKDMIWLGDYLTTQWVRADSALILKTDSIRTPMGYGILAYASQDSFDLAIKNLHGLQVQLHQQ